MYSLSLLFKLNTRQKPSFGFGLIELLVSVSIVLLVTSIVMARQSSFNGAVLLRSQAYDIALAAREVQMNAVSSISVNGDFRTLLGVHFDTNNDAVYVLFRDADNDGFFDANEVLGKQGRVGDKFEVRAIRSVGGRAINGNALSVVFERPNFDARFFDSAGELSNASKVEIDIARRDKSGDGVDAVRVLEITGAGQIAVKCKINPCQ